MKLELTPKQVAEASGCSLRMAYHYLSGDFSWSSKVALAVEKAFGVPRLHLLYPNEYGPDGEPIQPAESIEIQAHG